MVTNSVMQVIETGLMVLSTTELLRDRQLQLFYILARSSGLPREAQSLYFYVKSDYSVLTLTNTVKAKGNNFFIIIFVFVVCSVHVCVQMCSPKWKQKVEIRYFLLMLPSYFLRSLSLARKPKTYSKESYVFSHEIKII